MRLTSRNNPFRALGSVLLPVLVLSLVGCFGGSAKTGGQPLTAKEVFEEKCSACHGLNVALDESHTLAGWQKVVAQEAARKKWSISSREQAVIAEYLFRVRPADKEPPPKLKTPDPHPKYTAPADGNT